MCGRAGVMVPKLDVRDLTLFWMIWRKPLEDFLTHERYAQVLKSLLNL